MFKNLLPTSWEVIPYIILCTTVIYVLVLVGIRLTGKREVGQMTPFDLTLLLLLSNSVQNAMTGGDNSLVGGVVAAIVLLGLNYALAEVAGFNRRFRKLVQGSPTLLIHNGQCIQDHIAKEHVSMDELNRSLREHGVSCIDDVALAVLEVDGAISILKYDDVPDNVKPQKRLRFLHRN
jgi:uncharacterized membrane protein YcaP (DUF421 family)